MPRPLGSRPRPLLASSAVATELEELLERLDLEGLEVSPGRRAGARLRGLVLGQALVATGRTVEERVPHLLHGYFLRPGDPSIPLPLLQAREASAHTQIGSFPRPPNPCPPTAATLVDVPERSQLLLLGLPLLSRWLLHIGAELPEPQASDHGKMRLPPGAYRVSKR